MGEASAVTADRALREVLEGLRRRPRTISSKYHYDAKGSELFEKITRLDEYYPTRTERAILKGRVPQWVDADRPSTLIELGAGNAEKSRLVLDAMVAAGSGRAYVPVDVSADFLAATADALREEYPTLEVVPEVADITEPLRLPDALPHPRWIALLGSTLGNFEPRSAVDLMRRVAKRLNSDDRFLLGVDLRPGPHKSAERIELAYNDPYGVTEAFALNLLDVVNEEFGSDFDTDGFMHRAVYDEEQGQIVTDLVARSPQTVRFPTGDTLEIAQNEAIRTEISAKYDRKTIDDLFAEAGLAVARWVEDESGFYALVLAAPC